MEIDIGQNNSNKDDDDDDDDENNNDVKSGLHERHRTGNSLSTRSEENQDCIQ